MSTTHASNKTMESTDDYDSGRTSASSWTELRWDKSPPMDESITDLMKPVQVSFEKSSNNLTDEYDLTYSGPTVEEDIHKLVVERAKHENDPLLALVHISALLEDEIENGGLLKTDEERCYLNYLRVCLFQMKESGSLTRSALRSFRASVRNATEEDGVIPISPPIPHPFARGKLRMVGSFQVVKTLDATSRPKVIRLFSYNDSDDQKPVSPDVLYKIGDDLRQDLLILSSIATYNLRWRKVWEDQGPIDVSQVTSVPQTQTYRVLPWGPCDGLIELVQDVTDQREWVEAVSAQKYFASCGAAVTVGWVLGIGDRHRRNVLSTSDGEVFHIDFGYAFGLHPPMLKGAAVPVPKQMYNDLTSEDLWDVFVNLCLILFDEIASGADIASRVVEAMAKMIGYQVPDKVTDTLGGYIRNQLSTEGREKFHKSILNAPFSLQNEFKESIIPFWYKQVKRYHKHKQAGTDVVGHVKVEAEAFRGAANAVQSAGRHLIPNLTAFCAEAESRLLKK